MNKEQHITEYQQAAKATMEHAKEKERVHEAQNYIYISSDSLSLSSSDDSSETLFDDSYDLVTRQN